METKANYVLIGAFTIAVAVFGLLFALWAAKYSSDKSWQEYDVLFNEAVTGLSEGGSVQYSGISIGTIEKLSLDPRDPRRVVARIKIESNTPVKTDTRAKLSQAGLTGAPFIQLTGGTPASPALVDVDKRDVPVIRSEPSALQNIADTANRLVERLDQVLSEQNVKRIAGTLENIETLSAGLAQERDDISALIASTRSAAERLDATLVTTQSAVSRLDREVIAELPAMVDKLDRSLAAIESAAKNTNSLVAENRAPIAAFTKGGLQQVGPTLAEFRVLMRDLRRVVSRLDKNPAGYVLGRQQPKEFEPK